MNSKTSVAVDFGGKRLRPWSHGFVCQTRKVNACGHIPVRDLIIAYSVNSKRATLIRGKSIHESFRGSNLGSTIVGCNRVRTLMTHQNSMTFHDFFHDFLKYSMT